MMQVLIQIIRREVASLLLSDSIIMYLLEEAGGDLN